LYPKQLVKFIGEDSLIQSTVKRLLPVLDSERIRIVCGQEHYHEIARHLEEIRIAAGGKIIREPCGRNTAPAILLAVLQVLKDAPDAVLCVFPADHVIRDIGEFHAKLQSAINLAEAGHVVTFGITPHYPETGYGYIEGAEAVSDGALITKRFVEKPDEETARGYIEAGNFFWNSGMFAFKAAVIVDEFKQHQPELFKKMSSLEMTPQGVTMDDYAQLPDISIHYAIMEKTRKGVVLPSDFGWSDIGSWKSLYEFLPKDAQDNVIDGDVIAKDTHRSFIMGRQRLIAANHLKNIVIVETPDSIFVSDIDNSRDVKAIVADLKQEGRDEYHRHRKVYHPWGSATLLEEGDDCRVTRLEVYPQSGCPCDKGRAVARIFTVTEGSARVGTGDDSHLLAVGESMKIAAEDGWRIENPGSQPLQMIQVDVYVK
jgi:mannose-1-phosphate guanylyltransferase/mannose-6-phosphate isomerase